jgi:hypothetical protein
MVGSIDIQGIDFAEKEETLCENNMIFRERLDALCVMPLTNEDDARNYDSMYRALISDMQSLHQNIFRKDPISDRTGFPGNSLHFEGIQAAVA